MTQTKGPSLLTKFTRAFYLKTQDIESCVKFLAHALLLICSENVGKANFVNKNHDYSVSVFTNKLTLAQSSNITVKICTVRSIHSAQLEYHYCRKLKCKLFYPR